MRTDAHIPVRVVCIDDSSTARSMLIRALGADVGIEVVAAVGDAVEGRDAIVRLRPDVLLLDLNMPGMAGLAFLERLMRYVPMPVIVVSSLTRSCSEEAVRAFSLGALEVLGKPKRSRELPQFSADLTRAVRAVARVDVGAVMARQVRVAIPAYPQRRFAADRVVAIGASTGGPRALEELLGPLPAGGPPILVVQHMPAEFVGKFAQRLDGLCEMRVKVAEHGEEITPGTALIAGTDSHMQVKRRGTAAVVRLVDGPRESGHCPSVDVLFRSVARQLGNRGIGVLLTGMGADGADGLVEMRQSGARTITQDEATSLIFGMPKEGAVRGGSEAALPLQAIGARVLDLAMAPPVTGPL